MRSTSLFFIYCLVLAIVTYSQPNYQQRRVYYSQTDNACLISPVADTLDLILKIDEYPITRTLEVYAGAWCLSNVRDYIFAIKVLDGFQYQNLQLGEKIYFENKLIKNHIFGEVTSMDVKTTVTDECIINFRPCRCKILGDGLKQHFGIIFPDKQRASIYLHCSFVPEQIE